MKTDPKIFFSFFKKKYPKARCALNHKNPFELLISTILSAQCTDARVNQVTPKLFAQCPSPQKMSKASQKSIETLIFSTGFYKNKAKSILESSKDLVEKHGGEVPQTMEALTALRGVGRKTANVVLGNAFGKNVGVVVDTHVGRISRRLGLTRHKDPVKVEKDLMQVVPQKDWTSFSHWLILFGREVCKAQKPLCQQCEIEKICPRIGVV